MSTKLNAILAHKLRGVHQVVNDSPLIVQHISGKKQRISPQEFAEEWRLIAWPDQVEPLTFAAYQNGLLVAKVEFSALQTVDFQFRGAAEKLQFRDQLHECLTSSERLPVDIDLVERLQSCSKYYRSLNLEVPIKA